MATVKSVIERLQTYGMDEEVACPIWSKKDVIGYAKQKGWKIPTDGQAEEVIALIDRTHDAELGISWTTIDCAYDEIVG